MLAQHLRNLLGQDANVKTLVEAKVCDVDDILTRVDFGTLNIVADADVDLQAVLQRLVPIELALANRSELNRPVRVEIRRNYTLSLGTTDKDNRFSTSEVVHTCYMPFNIDIVLLPHLRHAVADDFGASVRDIQRLVRAYSMRPNSYTMFVFNNSMPWSCQPIVTFFKSQPDYCPRGGLFIPSLADFNRALQVSLPLDKAILDPLPGANVDLAWRPTPALDDLAKPKVLTHVPWYNVAPSAEEGEFYENLRRSVGELHSELKDLDTVFAEHKPAFEALCREINWKYTKSGFTEPAVRHGIHMGVAHATVLHHIHRPVPACVELALVALSSANCLETK